MFKNKNWMVSIMVLVLMLLTGLLPTVQAQDSSITIVIPEDPPTFNAAATDTGYDSLVMELVMLGLADIDPYG